MFDADLLKESFVGFTIDGIHSSSLGIMRAAQGTMSISTPEFNDVTIPRVGADGELWYGSTYTKKDIQIEFAYDGLTEQQLLNIKNFFNNKKLVSLVLDEEPYKIWMVKASQSMINQLCFEENNQRVYRGEGKVVFTSQVPYAKCPYLYKECFKLNEETPTIIYEGTEEEYGAIYSDVKNPEVAVRYYTTPINYKEWFDETIFPTQEEQFYFDSEHLDIYNAGDLPVGFKIYFNSQDCQAHVLKFKSSVGDINIELQKNSYSAPYICLDFYQNSIYGCDPYYNKIPNTNYGKFLSKDKFGTLKTGKTTFECNIQPKKIEMYYLFF